MRVPQNFPLSQRALSGVAALVLATTPFPTPPALATSGAPTTEELAKMPRGLARIDYLLDHWDEETTICKGVSDGVTDLEDKQVVRTQNQNKCSKSPLKVQKFIGAASTTDPLFKIDKLMIRANVLVAEDQKADYADAVDEWITKQQMSSTMAYTSSWSGYENPNGNAQAIDDALLETKNEVKDTQRILKKVVGYLNLPSDVLQSSYLAGLQDANKL